jgi:hypothetical protein
LKYLYGDATASPLDRNYIEYLRDLLELSASLLAAHAVTTKLARDASDREIGAGIVQHQLQELAKRVQGTLEGCGGPQMTSIATTAVDNMRALCTKELQRAEASLTSTLRADLDKIAKAVATERAQHHGRMQKLLLKHDLPESSQWVSVQLPKEGAYRAALTGKASCGISWIVELAIPEGHLFSEALRVDRLAPQLTVKLPQESGWVRKSVKLRTHKLGSMYVAEIGRSQKYMAIKLRASSQDDTGFDLRRPSQGQTLQVARIDKGTAEEPYEPDHEDARGLLGLWDELLQAATSLQDSRAALIDCRFEGTPLGELTDPTDLVQRLIAQAAPIARLIAKHSLSPTELVLKRVLADDRREEIFASKADLLEIFQSLPAKLRKLFDPLGLEDDSDARPSGAGDEAPVAPTPDASRDATETRVVGPLPRPSTPPLPRPSTPPLPKPSTPPPRRRKTQPGVAAPTRKLPGPPPRHAPAGSDNGQPSPTTPATGDSVEVPLDDLESK